MSAFDDSERTLQGGADHLISCFDYLNASARPEAAAVRATVDGFLDRYPQEHRGALIRRLKSVDDRVHRSAFFELALHELVLREGGTVVAVEPQIAGINRSPDFLVEDRNGHRFYLEAVLATGQSQVEAAGDARMNAALAAIDGVNSPNYLLSVHTCGTPTQPVSRRRLRQQVQNWIDQLNYEDVATACDSDDGDVPSHLFEVHGASFRIEPYPRRRLRGHDNRRAIGLFGPEHLIDVQPHVAIREAVEGKAGRYGELDLPYVIAVNALSEFCDDDSVIDALFGTYAVVFEPTEDGMGYRQRDIRNRDGAWHWHQGPRNKRVSAVLSAKRLTPWSLDQCRALLTLNPWARRPLVCAPLGVDQRWVENDRLRTQEGRTIGQIFGLPNGWPNG